MTDHNQGIVALEARHRNERDERDGLKRNENAGVTQLQEAATEQVQPQPRQSLLEHEKAIQQLKTDHDQEIIALEARQR